MKRRIILKDATDFTIQGKVIDVTDVDNANSTCPIIIAVEEQCDMLHWHTIDRIYTSPWGNRLDK
jgi:hypothetical protein